jgi:hypothetical protein
MQIHNEASARDHIAEMQRQRNHYRLVQEAKAAQPKKVGWFARLLGRSAKPVVGVTGEQRAERLTEARS